MKTRYTELRNAFREAHITQGEIAKELGISEKSMCFRMSGRYPFTLTEVYKILDMRAKPYSDLPKLFPKDGVAANAPKSPEFGAANWLEAYADEIKRTIDVRLQMAVATLAKQS